MVDTIKFSEFVDGGDLEPNQVTVGLESGVNVQFTNPFPLLPPGSTGDRPAPAASMYYRLRFNTTLESYEYYSPVEADWIQLEDSTDIAVLLALLASHQPGEGASLIGLENQGTILNKTVQDLANATVITNQNDGVFANGDNLASKPTGMLASTTTSGALDSRIITGTPNQVDVANGDGSANPTLSLSAALDLPGTFTIQSSTVVDEIINDDTMVAATADNLSTSLSIKNYVDGRTASVGSAGTIMRSNGTNWVASTSTFANTYSASDLLYSNGANTVTGLATANSAVLRTNGTGVPAWSSSMTNGQLLIGSTGDAPVVATLTAGTGISIANSAGSITISGSGGGYSWTEVTGTSQSMAVNNGYIANNAGLVTLTLPSSAVVGDTVTVQGKGAGLFRIAQNEDQIIRFGSSSTTTGVGGYLEATNRYDSIELLCIMQDLEWAVLTGVQGIFTVV